MRVIDEDHWEFAVVSVYIDDWLGNLDKNIYSLHMIVPRIPR